MKIAIIINSKRLPPEFESSLHQAATSLSCNYDLFVEEPKQIEPVLRNLNRESYSAIVIGGGDGTVRTAAKVLVGSDVGLAILPLGTFNLLAKSLHTPDSIQTVLQMISNGKTKLIDVAEVNDEVIINHAWVGFYYDVLKARKKHRALLGKNKLLKMIFNTLATFRKLPIYKLELCVDQKTMCFKTCLLYVGNNEFNTYLLELGERKTLSAGLLSVTILNCHSRLELVFCGLSLIFNKNKSSKYVTHFNTDQFSLEENNTPIETVIDGELFKFKGPLKFVSRQKQLKVFIP